MPQDARDYDRALLWRGIAQTVGYTANSEPKWRGNLEGFLGKQESLETTVEIYAKAAKAQP
jgi:hypothetical protein